MRSAASFRSASHRSPCFFWKSSIPMRAPSETTFEVRHGTRSAKPPKVDAIANVHAARPLQESRRTAAAESRLAAGPAPTSNKARAERRSLELGIISACPPSHASRPLWSEIWNRRSINNGPIRSDLNRKPAHSPPSTCPISCTATAAYAIRKANRPSEAILPPVHDISNTSGNAFLSCSYKAGKDQTCRIASAARIAPTSTIAGPVRPRVPAPRGTIGGSGACRSRIGVRLQGIAAFVAVIVQRIIRAMMDVPADN